MNIFRKEYSDESLYDLGQDVEEAINPEYNDLITKIPKDEHGFMKGSFQVTIEWVQDDE